MFSMLIAAAILGIMLFVSLVVLPVAFGKLPKDQAGVFVRKLFPIYHGALFLASQIAGFLAMTPHLRPVAFIAGFIFALHFVFLTPAVNRASDMGETARFKKLHTLSVIVNLVVMGLFAFALCVDACYF